MTQKEKETLNRLLKDKHIDAKIKWIAIDTNKNILGFRKQPGFDLEKNEWVSFDKTSPVWFGMVSFESVKCYHMEKDMLISIKELQKLTKPDFMWDADLVDRVDVDLQDAYYNINQLLKTIPHDKTICLCCNFGKVIKGKILNIGWNEFDFIADDSEVYRFKYYQMLLNKPPFSISDNGSICIHMNVKWEYYDKD